MMQQLAKSLLLTLATATLGLGCASGGDAGSQVGGAGGGSKPVIQSGPQDIGEFRSILDDGAVPALGVLDERGFFAEHQIDLPAADCGDSLCVHPMLAVAPRFDGGNWSMAFVGMNTMLDARTLATRPRHLVLVIDTLFDRRPSIINLATILQDRLGENDRVSVITYEDRVEVPLEGASASELVDLVLPANTTAADPPLYAGLSEALRVVDAPAFVDYEQRALVFGAKLEFGESAPSTSFYDELATEFALRDVAISVFTSTPGELAYVLSEASNGNYYFVEDSADLSDALTVEADTAFVPIARNLKLTFEAAEGYRIGRVFGAPRAKVDGKLAILESPVSYIGTRDSSDDLDMGRRGGGGGWFVQLLADVEPGLVDAPPAKAFTLQVEYQDTQSGQLVEKAMSVETPLGVGQNPPPREPFFSDPERGKPFMMLNMYLALATTTMLANENQCGAALAIEPMMKQAWEIFTELFPDPDIDADFELLQQLSANIADQCQEPMATSIDVPPVPMGCGYL